MKILKNKWVLRNKHHPDYTYSLLNIKPCSNNTSICKQTCHSVFGKGMMIFVKNHPTEHSYHLCGDAVKWVKTRNENPLQ